jgi:hypothetical protein
MILTLVSTHKREISIITKKINLSLYNKVRSCIQGVKLGTTQHREEADDDGSEGHWLK